MVVKGGYSPDVRVRAGIPLRLRFDRQESGDCTARVIFADFALARSLPANATTVVELTPIATGRFGFACGMSMVHGTLVVEGSVDTPAPPQLDPIPAQPEETPAAGPRDDDREAAATRAEIADLTRRVAVGALFTAPVLFAVMATELFKVDWVPAFLMNRWLQLALIAPVMTYTGWPIHTPAGSRCATGPPT